MNELRIKDKDKTIVVGVGLKTEALTEIKENLCELEELVVAAGGDVVGSTVQVLPTWNPATLIGSGKVQEIKEMVQEAGAHAVVIDHQLTGIQARNLQEEIKVRVLDRTQLILDIFAQRARTYEGKLQVDLVIRRTAGRAIARSARAWPRLRFRR